MNLYFYTKEKAAAATTLADLAAYIATIANPTSQANRAIRARIEDSIESFTQGDGAEPLNLYFSADGATYDAWSTDAAVTLAVGIGYSDANAQNLFTSTTSFTISGNARVGSLAMNTTALGDAIANRFSIWPPPRFTLHVRKTTAGVTETVALLPIPISVGVMP